MSARLRWGVLGTARIVRKTIPALQKTKNGEVVGIASRSGEKAREYANKYGVPQSFGSYEALLAAEVLGQLTFVHVAHSFDAGGGDNIRWYSGLGGGALFDTRSRFLIRA